MKMSKNKLTIRILVLVVIALAVSFWFWKQKNTNLQKPAEKEVMNQEQKTDEIDTSDWQTYRNEELGIEFKYPKDFYLLDRLSQEEGSILISDKEIVYSDMGGAYLSEIKITKDPRYLYGFDNMLNKKENRIIIGGKKVIITEGIFLEDKAQWPKDILHIFFEDQNIFLTSSNIQYPVDIRKQNITDFNLILKNILSTIQFD